MKIKNNIPLFILISSFLGSSIGILNPTLALNLKPLSDIYFNLLYTFIVPFIFFVLTQTIINLKCNIKIMKILKKTITIFVLTSLLSALFMLLVILIIDPTKNSNIIFSVFFETIDIENYIINTFVVADFISLFNKNNLLPLVIIAIILGIIINKSEVPNLKKVLNDIMKIFLKIIDKLSYLNIFVIFIISANLINQIKNNFVGNYAYAVIAFTITTITFFLLFYTLYAYISKGLKGVINFYKNIIPSIITAFTTNSSLTTLPINIKTANKMNINSKKSRLILILGTFIHAEGTTMSIIFKIVFLFNIFNAPFIGINNYIIAITLALILPLFTTKTPNGNLISDFIIITVYGFNQVALPIITTVSLLIEPLVTTLNVCGDISSTMLITKNENSYT